MIFIDKYAFLSNFYKTPIKYTHNGKQYIYKCSEALYQAFKTGSRFGLYEYQEYNGGQAKKASHKNIVVANWQDIKVDRMRLCLKLKFNQNIELKKRLIELNEQIEETNLYHDNFWGNCICEKCLNKKGKNMLGQLLIELREEYRGELNEPSKKQTVL